MQVLSDDFVAGSLQALPTSVHVEHALVWLVCHVKVRARGFNRVRAWSSLLFARQFVDTGNKCTGLRRQPSGLVQGRRVSARALTLCTNVARRKVLCVCKVHSKMVPWSQNWTAVNDREMRMLRKEMVTDGEPACIYATDTTVDASHQQRLLLRDTRSQQLLIGQSFRMC